MHDPGSSAAFLSPFTEERGTGSDILISACYHPDRFDRALFAQSGLALPDALSRAVPKRQAEFLAGRITAHEALRRLGVDAGDIGRGRFGEPLWPEGVRGALTHSKGFVAAWLTTGDWQPGLDAEHMPRPSAIEAIRAGVLTDAERAQSLTDREHVALFSAKEALFKALFPQVGAWFGFTAAELDGPITETHLRLQLTAPLADGLGKGARFDVALSWTGPRVMSRIRGPRARP